MLDGGEADGNTTETDTDSNATETNETVADTTADAAVRFLVDNSTNATNGTNETTTNETTPDATEEDDDLEDWEDLSSSDDVKTTVSKVITAVDGVTSAASNKFDGLSFGTSYNWWCIASNNNPNLKYASFTAVVTGTKAIAAEVIVPPVVVPTVGATTILSTVSMIISILLIALYH